MVKNICVAIDISDKDDKIASDVGDCKRIRSNVLLRMRAGQRQREQRFYRLGYEQMYESLFGIYGRINVDFCCKLLIRSAKL